MTGKAEQNPQPHDVIPHGILLRTCEPVPGRHNAQWRLGAFGTDISLFGSTPEHQADELLSLLEFAPGNAAIWEHGGVENTFDEVSPYTIVAHRALVTASKNLARADRLASELPRAMQGPNRDKLHRDFLPRFNHLLQAVWISQGNDPQAVARLTGVAYRLLPEETFVHNITEATENALNTGKSWAAVGSTLLNVLLELPDRSLAGTELGAHYTHEQKIQERTVADQIAEEIANGDIRRFPELTEILHNPFATPQNRATVTMIKLLRSALHVGLTEERHDLWLQNNGHTKEARIQQRIHEQARGVVNNILRDFESPGDIATLHGSTSPQELRDTLQDILFLYCTRPRSAPSYWFYFQKAQTLFGHNSPLIRDIREHHKRVLSGLHEDEQNTQ